MKRCLAKSPDERWGGHPQSRYVALGPIGRDQVLDYPRREGMDLRAVERWLAPNLAYDPADA